MVTPRWYHSRIMTVEPYKPGYVCVQFELTKMWLVVPTERVSPREGEMASWWGYSFNDSARLIIGEVEVWNHV